MKEGIEVVHIALRYRAGTAFGPRPKLAGLANRFDNMANVMFHCQLLLALCRAHTDPTFFLSALQTRFCLQGRQRERFRLSRIGLTDRPRIPEWPHQSRPCLPPRQARRLSLQLPRAEPIGQSPIPASPSGSPVYPLCLAGSRWLANPNPCSPMLPISSEPPWQPSKRCKLPRRPLAPPPPGSQSR